MATVTTDYIVLTAGIGHDSDHGSWSQHEERADAIKLARHFDGEHGLVYKRTSESGGRETWKRIILHKV